VLISLGDTRVLCNCTVENSLPSWMKGQQQGWLTAEYSLLPASTHTRSRRERSSVGGRTQEIQRLIGRSLRACLDREALGERTMLIDCDVLQADGGTRTASITGAFVATALAASRLVQRGELSRFPLLRPIAALSCGIVAGELLLDLDYAEDSRAELDMNLVACAPDEFIEVQATAESGVLPRKQLDALLDLASRQFSALFAAQREALAGVGHPLPFA
jgi:ribonuclease PH